MFKDLVNNLLGVAIPTFGEYVEYRPRSGGKLTLIAVFDQPADDLNTETQVIMNVTRPRLGIRLKDLPKAEPGDKVRIKNELFEITNVDEDGQGGAYLYLLRLS
jgi:hypothetical protein